MKKLSAFVATAALAVTLGACSSDPQEAAAICVDRGTGIRVDDSMCQPVAGVSPYFPPYFIPWYITPGYTIPAYGYPTVYGFAHLPHGYVTVSTPSAGGVINKRSWGSSSSQPRGVQPAAAATQQPQPKKRFWSSQPKSQTTKAPTTTKAPPAQPRPAQQKPQWQTYKAPTQSRPVAPRPPTYSKYR